MENLPKVMVDELAACPRQDCRVREAQGEPGINIINNSLFLECAACDQIWELEAFGGEFTHWDRTGKPHISSVTYSIGSKWPKGESQCESVGGIAMRKRFVNASR